MNTEQRNHHRFSPKGVHALIDFSHPQQSEHIYLEGYMLDMSYSGIRIKLLDALPNSLRDGHVHITLTLPMSKMQCVIKGDIKHINSTTEMGVGYAPFHCESEMDAFIFECVKHVEDHSAVG
ncbi:PilZ domain-containing protein [Aestuariibacter salexigens]|uniref:PilZ domain-containing protein n=1 Tax=Aestuariibacter salexigens TaxID=226010 RepID=UPI000479B201|nr:PilZ domain-containing protein [Aestuariibacter salexigens]